MAKKPAKKQTAKKPVNKTKAIVKAKVKPEFIYLVLCISLMKGRNLFTAKKFDTLALAQERVKWSKNLDITEGYEVYEYLILQFQITRANGKTK